MKYVHYSYLNVRLRILGNASKIYAMPRAHECVMGSPMPLLLRRAWHPTVLRKTACEDRNKKMHTLSMHVCPKLEP